MQTRFIRWSVVVFKKLKHASCGWLWLLIVLILAGAGAPIKTKAESVLPATLAIQLPHTHQTTTAPREEALREVLQSAMAGGSKVTHDRSGPLSLGGTLITWTAWDGAPAESRASATKSAYVYVLPQ